MDYILKNAEQEHRANSGEGFVTKPKRSARLNSRETTTSLNDLDFADDIALLEGSLDRAQQQLSITAKKAREVGLEVNVQKTEAFSNQEHASANEAIHTHEYIELDGQRIEWVKNFKYLGSMVASSETDIRARKGQAWGALWKMKDIFRSKTIPIRLKTDIWQASCLSILLYGCESWIITKKLENSLNSFATSCYRVMLNIKRIDKVSNKKIHEMIGIQEPLVLKVQRRQFRFIGHSLRKAESELINKYALYTPEPSHRNRGRGKPQMLYPNYIAKLINSEIRSTIDEIRASAKN